jgi:hypothetical protein
MWDPACQRPRSARYATSRHRARKGMRGTRATVAAAAAAARCCCSCCCCFRRRRYSLLVSTRTPPPSITQVLKFERQYLDALPSAQMYEKSYMHRDTITHVVVRVTA